MVDRSLEERHLALIDRLIAEGEERLARQHNLVERLKAQGQDTTQGKSLLDSIADRLNTARVRRLLILERLGER
jgi:arginine repressor